MRRGRDDVRRRDVVGWDGRRLGVGEGVEG